MEKIKVLYNLMPYILPVWLILNIIGNTIKMTSLLDTKYIIWILLVISIIINFCFFGIKFESFFIAFITFSFSVSSYDLVKYFTKIRGK
ncbi:MAG: phage holin family protein [Bacilli bacterium]